MGRDLLNKPQVPQPVPEEEEEGQKAKKSGKARSLGDVGDVVPKEMLSPGAKTKAFRHAYFNADSSGVKEANFTKSGMKALRGSEEATDLKKVVLPGSELVDSPAGDVVRRALDRMGLDRAFASDLSGSLQRLGQWTKEEGRTADEIEARQQELESMVEARKAALQRMQSMAQEHVERNPTLAKAQQGASDEELQQVVDVGTELMQESSTQAAKMHKHLAKMFGVKLNPGSEGGPTKA